MKLKLLAAIAAVTVISQPVAADPAFSLGVTFNFGGQNASGIGITAGIWSDNTEEEFTGGLTGTFYPTSNQFGAGVAVGYNFENGVGMLGYDFLQRNAQFGVGFANIEGKEEESGPQQEPEGEQEIIVVQDPT